jgi:predicted Mrr-cat superfamily restriction endonuclease
MRGKILLVIILTKLINSLSLPSPLEEDKLITLLVDNDGSYEDQGTKQRLSSEVLRVVRTMKVGQKVLIPEEEKEDGQTHIWSVHFSAFRLLLTW